MSNHKIYPPLLLLSFSLLPILIHSHSSFEQHSSKLNVEMEIEQQLPKNRTEYLCYNDQFRSQTKTAPPTIPCSDDLSSYPNILLSLSSPTSMILIHSTTNNNHNNTESCSNIGTWLYPVQEVITPSSSKNDNKKNPNWLTKTQGKPAMIGPQYEKYIQRNRVSNSNKFDVFISIR